MISDITSKRKNLSYRILSCFIAVTFIFNVVLPPGYAQLIPQTILNLPAPGTMVPLSAGFTPLLVKGITIHPDNPLRFDFIVDPGQSGLEGEQLRSESTRLIKYFLASLTVPEDELWVNLSPYEKDRMISGTLGETVMGRDMLAQDYILKQLTASLMYPEEELGKKFWDKIYSQAREKYGTTEIPVNTFNKVWIVPQKAVVYQHGNSALAVESHLKVMLEEDYEAMNSNVRNADLRSVQEQGGVTAEIIREVIIPAIEKEVNTGETFTMLRQIYNSMILAAWYKQNLKESLLGQVYVNQAKTKGVDVADKEVNQKIYAQYLAAFKKGVYNYIKEDYDPASQNVIPRKYFSGGMSASPVFKMDAGVFEERDVPEETFLSSAKKNLGRRAWVATADLWEDLGRNEETIAEAQKKALAARAATNLEEADKIINEAFARGTQKPVALAASPVAAYKELNPAGQEVIKIINSIAQSERPQIDNPEILNKLGEKIDLLQPRNRATVAFNSLNDIERKVVIAVETGRKLAIHDALEYLAYAALNPQETKFVDDLQARGQTRTQAFEALADDRRTQELSKENVKKQSASPVKDSLKTSLGMDEQLVEFIGGIINLPEETLGDDAGLATHWIWNVIKSSEAYKIRPFLKRQIERLVERRGGENIARMIVDNDGKDVHKDGKWVVRATSIQSNFNLLGHIANGTSIEIYEQKEDGTLDTGPPLASIAVMWGQQVRVFVANKRGAQDYELRSDGSLVEVKKEGQENNLIKMKKKGTFISLSGGSRSWPKVFQSFKTEILDKQETKARDAQASIPDMAQMIEENGLMAAWMNWGEAFAVAQMMAAAGGTALVMTQTGLKRISSIQVTEGRLESKEPVFVYAGVENLAQQIELWGNVLNVKDENGNGVAAKLVDVLNKMREEIPTSTSVSALLSRIGQELSYLPATEKLKGDALVEAGQLRSLFGQEVTAEGEWTRKKTTLEILRDILDDIKQHQSQNRFGIDMMRDLRIVVGAMEKNFEASVTEKRPALKQMELPATALGESFQSYLDNVHISPGSRLPPEQAEIILSQIKRLSNNVVDALTKSIKLSALGDDDAQRDIIRRLKTIGPWMFYTDGGEEYLNSMLWIMYNLNAHELDLREELNEPNASGDIQKALDVIFNKIFILLLRQNAHVVISEEDKTNVYGIDQLGKKADDSYRIVAILDPIDGSSQIKKAQPFGTILGFGFLKPGQAMADGFFNRWNQMVTGFDVQYGPSIALRLINLANNEGRRELVQFKLVDNAVFQKELEVQKLIDTEMTNLRWGNLLRPDPGSSTEIHLGLGGALAKTPLNRGHKEFISWLGKVYGTFSIYTGALQADEFLKMLAYRRAPQRAGVLYTYEMDDKGKPKLRDWFEGLYYALVNWAMGGILTTGDQPLQNRQTPGEELSGKSVPYFSGSSWILNMYMAWLDYLTKGLQAKTITETDAGVQAAFDQFRQDYDGQSERLLGEIEEYSRRPGVTARTKEEIRRALLTFDSTDKEENFFPRLLQMSGEQAYQKLQWASSPVAAWDAQEWDRQIQQLYNAKSFRGGDSALENILAALRGSDEGVIKLALDSSAKALVALETEENEIAGLPADEQQAERVKIQSSRGLVEQIRAAAWKRHDALAAEGVISSPAMTEKAVDTVLWFVDLFLAGRDRKTQIIGVLKKYLMEEINLNLTAEQLFELRPSFWMTSNTSMEQLADIGQIKDELAVLKTMAKFSLITRLDDLYEKRRVIVDFIRHRTELWSRANAERKLGENANTVLDDVIRERSASSPLENSRQTSVISHQLTTDDGRLTTNPGGINLDPALLDLQIKRDANFVPLPLPQQPIGEMHIDGFIPVIINIVPVTNLPLLLGLADTQQNTDETIPASKARELEEISALN